MASTQSLSDMVQVRLCSAEPGVRGETAEWWLSICFVSSTNCLCDFWPSHAGPLALVFSASGKVLFPLSLTHIGERSQGAAPYHVSLELDLSQLKE